jgi:hypothetical protein
MKASIYKRLYEVCCVAVFFICISTQAVDGKEECRTTSSFPPHLVCTHTEEPIPTPYAPTNAEETQVQAQTQAQIHILIENVRDRYGPGKDTTIHSAIIPRPTGYQVYLWIYPNPRYSRNTAEAIIRNFSAELYYALYTSKHDIELVHIQTQFPSEESKATEITRSQADTIPWNMSKKLVIESLIHWMEIRQG